MHTTYTSLTHEELESLRCLPLMSICSSYDALWPQFSLHHCNKMKSPFCLSVNHLMHADELQMHPPTSAPVCLIYYYHYDYYYCSATMINRRVPDER